jgi:FkbM family methyltransferase
MSLISMALRRLKRKLGLSSPTFEENENIAPLISSQAKIIIGSHFKNKGSRALFIDMGSNLGQGFRFFSKYYNPNIFDYWLIEANPFCISSLHTNISKLYKRHSWKGNWKIINKAISYKDGTVQLFGLVEDQRGKTSDGASIIKDHNSKFYNSDYDQSLEVQSIKASNLINDALGEYSTIVIKMDIEASEYDALEDLIRTGYINNISHIYVEWHSQCFSENKIGDILIRENRIKKHLSNKLTEWH